MCARARVCVFVRSYIHGGGFHTGNASMFAGVHERTVKRLERHAHVDSVSVMSVDYPLTPHDCWFSSVSGSSHAIDAVVRTIRFLHHEWRVPIRSMIIAGDSAGGNLVLTATAKVRSTLL